VNAVLENPEKGWTYEDYLGLDDEGHFEIIGGKAFKSPSPELFHQPWVGDLFAILRQHIKVHELGKIFVVPIDLVLGRDNVVQPDPVSVSTANAGLLERRGIMGAPDLVVAVISPGSLRRDRYDKRELYARFGGAEFGLADVANHSLEVLTLQKEGYHSSSCATGGGKIHATILPGSELDQAQLD
jgi:Uma2 family endonuclease